MKKLYLFLFGFLLIMTGCSKSSLNANQIKYKEKILTYNTSEINDVFFDNGIDIVLNDANEIRSIAITNEDVKTFNDLSVGDKISKVKSKYQYETEYSNTVFAIIYDNNEIDIANEDKPEEAIYINYFYDNDIITKIQIYDSIYAKKMR